MAFTQACEWPRLFVHISQQVVTYAQAAYARNEDGSFLGYEPTPPFEYHDGYLTVHFDTGNYQKIQLAPLQEEALW